MNRGDQFPVKIFCYGTIGIGFKHLVIIPLEGRKRAKKDDDDDDKKPKHMGGHMYETKCLQGSVCRELLETNSFLIQDNAKAHTCSETTKYIETKRFRQLPDRLPPKSCDLNLPIERMWALVKRKVQEDNCWTIEELQASVRKRWDEISQATVDAMCTPEAWKNRCEDVITANGYFSWGKRARRAPPAK